MVSQQKNLPNWLLVVLLVLLTEGFINHFNFFEQLNKDEGIFHELIKCVLVSSQLVRG